MKRILCTAAIAAFATSASAYTGATAQMAQQVETALEVYGISVPVTTLSDDQVVQIYLLTTSTEESEDVDVGTSIMGVIEQEDDTAAVEDAIDDAEIQALLAARDERRMLIVPGENSIRNSVAAFLDREGFEVDVDMLSDEQVALIYTEAFSDDNAVDEDYVQTILER